MKTKGQQMQRLANGNQPEQEDAGGRVGLGGTWGMVARVYGLVKIFTSSGRISVLNGDLERRMVGGREVLGALAFGAEVLSEHLRK